MGLKYFCEYRQLHSNNLWKVEIDIPNYSGTPIRKLGASEQTCIIEWNGSDKLLEKFITGSSASITLLFDNIAEVEELQTLNDKQAQVRVYDGTSLFWKGHLISDGIQYPDIGVSFPVTLNATDMIESANDITYVDTIAEAIEIPDNGGYWGSNRCPLNYIRKCLIYDKNINNSLPIRWSCSIKNKEYPTDDFFGGRTKFINNFDEFSSSRSSTSVGWMLENIVKSVGCVLFQYAGYWYIVSLSDIAQNQTLYFYEIDGNDLYLKQARKVLLTLDSWLPTKINESTFSMVQRPISKVKATYNHSILGNIIPNGGFDILEPSGRVLYWYASDNIINLSADVPINNRKGGYSLRVKNNTLISGSISYGIDGNMSTIPMDANLLFKDMQWGFTFMPINFPTDGSGFINWINNPLQANITYTGYNGNNLARYMLNEFGFWKLANIIGELQITEVIMPSPAPKLIIIAFSGDAKKGQEFTQWINGPAFVRYKFDQDYPRATALAILASKIVQGTAVVDGDTIRYTTTYKDRTVIYFDLSPSTGDNISLPNISFKVDAMKNNDIATVQFQSKGNQGRVLMPDPGVLDEMRALESGKLSLSFIIKGNQEMLLDDVYMNVADNKEYWELSDGGADGIEEFELDISSSFSGFITSSYMDNFTKSDLSMIMNNSIDTGTLTEIFGKTALRLLSHPTRKIDTEILGIRGLLNVLEYDSKKYLPLKASINTETNSTKLTMFELDYDTSLTIMSEHKSTGDGETGFSSGGYSGGGSGGGGSSEFLRDLKDVSINNPQNNQGLVYQSSTGKWVNADISVDLSNYYTKSQSDLRFQPLENQRLSTTNNVSFNGVKGLDYVGIPNKAPISSVSGWTIWVDEDGTGGGATPPPIIVNLRDLQDVQLTGLTNGQALVYNASLGKWVNGDAVPDLSNYYTKSQSDARFAFVGGSNAVGSWGIDITGKSSNSDGWNTYVFDNNIYSNGFDYIFARTTAQKEARLITQAGLKTWLNLPASGGYDLQGVTDRGNTTTKDINIGQYINLYAGAIKRGSIYVNSSSEIAILTAGGATGLKINSSNRVYIGNNPIGVETLNVDGWVSTNGDTGIYNSTYGGGIYMRDNTYIRVYGGKTFNAENILVDTGLIANNIRVNNVLDIQGRTSAGVATGNFWRIYVEE